MEVQEYQKYENEMEQEKLLKISFADQQKQKQMGCLLKANLATANITEIQQTLFDRFLENPEDSPYRCACLYCIQMISMLTTLKFNKIRQLA